MDNQRNNTIHKICVYNSHCIQWWVGIRIVTRTKTQHTWRLFPGVMMENMAEDIILEPRKIARHYLKTWFTLDLISSVPLDYVLLMISPDANMRQIMHAGRYCTQVSKAAHAMQVVIMSLDEYWKCSLSLRFFPIGWHYKCITDSRTIITVFNCNN